MPAIAWWEKYPNPVINSCVSSRVIFAIKGAYKNTGVGGHILIADKTGNSVVCECEKGNLEAEGSSRSDARYLVCGQRQGDA